jgi:putative transcriptional regulator
MRRFIQILALLAAAGLLAPGLVHAQIEKQRTFLLVAQPGLLDPAFHGTVVLTIRPDEGGPIGVILNRPSIIELRSLYPKRADLASRHDPVFLGGPVERDALLFAFRSPSKPAKALLVADDIYLSGTTEVLDELLKHPENAAQQRFFVGFCGWATGQLEDEIAQGGWYVLRFDAAVVFDMNPLTMYEELFRRASVPRIEASSGLRLAGAGLR